MQYFCGLSEFTDTPIFDASLFVTIRKRISEEEVNAMTTKMLLKQQRIQEERRRQKEQEARDKGEEPPKPKSEDPDAAEFTDSKGRKHKGILKIEVPEGTLSYPSRNMAAYNGYDHMLGVCLHPCFDESELIQRTLITTTTTTTSHSTF